MDQLLQVGLAVGLVGTVGVGLSEYFELKHSMEICASVTMLGLLITVGALLVRLFL